MFLRFLMSWITITIVAALLLLGGLGVLGWQWTVNTVSAGADDSEQDASTHRTRDDRLVEVGMEVRDLVGCS